MNWIHLALKSLWNRRVTALLTLLMVSVSVCLLLSVDRVRTDTRSSFGNTLSGTDLLIGSRTGSLNLLLYSVFRIGNATNNISWQSYQELKNHKDVKWTIPISLGDSHKGYRVVGTNESYLQHYQYGRQHGLKLQQGVWFADVFEVVLGAEVARQLNYQLGDAVVIAHGTGSTSFEQHDDRPFKVVGILAPTGTPVDKSLHIPLEGITVLHVDWQSGVKRQGKTTSVDDTLSLDLTPDSITAFLVGMNSRLKAFGFQRQVNEFRKEPLMAVIPGAALQELWQLIGIAENALMAVSVMVIVTGLIGMVTVIISSLNERRREIAIFRALGAKRNTLLGLLMVESGFYGLAGLVTGYGLHVLLMGIANSHVQNRYGIELTIGWPNESMMVILSSFLVTTVILGLLPGYRAYRQSLSDGLSANV
ncbi:FtsX-like permease family protein [Reinekea sp. G2M2-21]|uniref:ABC transporter permease n=1 Tax=Reinekea sp. G2M2-21 TaxID=2788942 RepID=UPI0018AB36EE|nr:ABC transporter permease [Reinekea sp. G2M2-21]